MIPKEQLEDVILSKENVEFVKNMLLNKLSWDNVWTHKICEHVERGNPTIQSTISALAKLLQPMHYLEIGVRRGFTMAMAGARNDMCQSIGFDLWIPGYAGIDNPGEEFVYGEMHNIGYDLFALIPGDSKQTVPNWFKANPDMFFDLILVDGDHSKFGALTDVYNTIAHLKEGGCLVLDDLHDLDVMEAWNIIQEQYSANHQFYTIKQIGFVWK